MGKIELKPWMVIRGKAVAECESCDFKFTGSWERQIREEHGRLVKCGK